MEQQIKRYELVELLVPALSTGRVRFQTIPQLRNQPDQVIQIDAINVFPVTSYAKSQVTNTIAGMPVAEIPKIVLVLYVNGEESIHEIPLAQMIHVNDGTSPFQQELWKFDNLKNVDFDKSYIMLNSTSDAAAYIIPFGISYIRFVEAPADGTPRFSNIPNAKGGWVEG